jgi:hypothetical protein
MQTHDIYSPEASALKKDAISTSGLSSVYRIIFRANYKSTRSKTSEKEPNTCSMYRKRFVRSGALFEICCQVNNRHLFQEIVSAAS